MNSVYRDWEMNFSIYLDYVQKLFERNLESLRLTDGD